jgi:anti-sigma regulatory factor (Ser/Thr protein kinase)
VPSLELSASPRCPRDARCFVNDAIDAWGVGGDTRDVIRLLTTELVTNAMLHGSPPIHVDVTRNGSTIRVAVADMNPMPPVVRPFDPAAATGHGLLLMDRLAGRWGVEANAEGKRVWFEVRRSPASPAPGAMSMPAPVGR